MFNIKQHFMTMFINGNEETATKSKTFFFNSKYTHKPSTPKKCFLRFRRISQIPLKEKTDI